MPLKISEEKMTSNGCGDSELDLNGEDVSDNSNESERKIFFRNVNGSFPFQMLARIYKYCLLRT